MKRLVLSQYLSFISIGFISSITGPLLPAIRREIPMTYGEAGLLLAGLCLGMVITIPVIGYLSDRYGKKPLLIAGGFLLACGLLGSMVAWSFLSIFFCSMIVGIGFGGFEVGINASCSSMNASNKGNAMSLLHFFYGIGAIVGPLLSTLCLRVFHHWRIVFGLAFFLPILVIFALRPVEIPKESPDKTGPNNFSYRDAFLWVCAAFILVYAGIEISIQGWIADYWQSIAGEIALPASIIASVFWIALTIGRLFSGRLADRIGLSRFLMMTSFGSIGLTLVWSVQGSPPITLGAVFILGLSLAGIFPTLMASATSHYPGRAGMVTAFISFFASLGGFFIPAAIGKITDSTGISKLPLIVCGLVMMLFLLSTGKAWLEKTHFIRDTKRMVGGME
ncbi:MAG TPA: MFS transporter [Bacillota bacterium]|nr:MFS transporter [Bacillota bacterium]